ncbi:RING-type domain-containing protein [Hirschfeldia incana]|nr:RING-type domain-containing protein [Hirschfeldia incana]
MDPSHHQPQVTLPHDNEVTESRGVIIELESESGSCFVDSIGHDSGTDVNSLSDFDEYDDDSGIRFRDIGQIRLISVESGSDDDPEDEREIWGIDLNEDDVYDDDDEDDVSVTIHSLQVDDSAVEFDWEEVDNGGGGEGEILSGFAEANISLEDLARDDGLGNNLEWQVLMNSHTLEINFDVENRELHIVGDHEDYIHTAEYDLLFEQFAQAGITNLRFPPTSESFIKNLPVVVQLDVENGDCAVCKDEMSIGGSEAVVLLLPCDHKYHGECIVPWLETRNTCPVCRYELPTDDVDYERRKSHIRR